MKTNRALFVTNAAFIAAVYVVLTYLANAFGLASGVIQVRLSEALCILPFFTPAAILAVTLLCTFAVFFVWLRKHKEKSI